MNANGAEEDDESEPQKTDAADAAMANLNALTVTNAPKKPTGKKAKGNQPTLNQLSSSTTLGFSMQPTAPSQPPSSAGQGAYGFPSGTGAGPTGGYAATGPYGFPAGPTGGGGAGGYGMGYGAGAYGGGFPTGPATTAPAKKAGGDAFSQFNVWN